MFYLFINVTNIFLIDESFNCSVSQFVRNIFDVVFYALLAEFFHSWNTATVKLLRLLLVWLWMQNNPWEMVEPPRCISITTTTWILAIIEQYCCKNLSSGVVHENLYPPSWGLDIAKVKPNTLELWPSSVLKSWCIFHLIWILKIVVATWSYC